MPYCPKCGEPVNESDVFCSRCGARLGRELGDLERTERAAVKTPETKDIATQVVAAQIPKATKGFLTYADKAVGFSVSYPENWKKMSESVDFLVGFEASEAEYGGRASYIVGHDELPAQESVQDYFAKTKRVLQKRLKEYAPISEEGLIIDKLPAIKHVYTFSEKGMPLKRVQIYLKQGKVGWVVTFTSTSDAFDSYQSTFETIATSFHLFGASRGEKARFVLSTAAIKSDIRGWGIGLIILGVIQIAVPLLDPVWGGILIAIGIMELFIQRRILYVLNGVVIIIAGIANMVIAVEEGVHIGGFAVLQFIWGGNEIRKFFKYQPTARGEEPKGLITKQPVVPPEVPKALPTKAWELESAPAEIPKVLLTKQPTIAGILSILAGVIELIIGFSLSLSEGNPFGWLVALVGIIAVVSGVYAIKREVWKLALAGAICSLVIFPLGIPAIILVVRSRSEFE